MKRFLPVFLPLHPRVPYIQNIKKNCIVQMLSVATAAAARKTALIFAGYPYSFLGTIKESSKYG